jgi:GNAT superfamily N-acetyltransferase
MAAYFAGCHNSGYQIVPGHVSPTNIVVPEPDFKTGATVRSLGGWKYYESTLSIIRPLIKNFYEKTWAHYPWSGKTLEYSWIFDACTEELGVSKGKEFLEHLGEDLKTLARSEEEVMLGAHLEDYLKRLDAEYYIHLPIKNAVQRYEEWTEVNPAATPEAREELIGELYRLYRIDRFGEPARYYLYRHTYFAHASDDVTDAFDYLLHILYKKPEVSAISLPELSDLQNALKDRYDRHVFSRLVFPRAKEVPNLEVLAVGERELKHIVVRSQIYDKAGMTYFVREPTEPSEIGQLYRLFLGQRYTKTISEQDKFLVALDSHERLIGGVCYLIQNEEVVYLDGIVVAPELQNKGLGGGLLEDFCIRMTNHGFEVIKTHFYVREFYLKRSFRVDKRWGGLVRFLGEMGDSDGISANLTL